MTTVDVAIPCYRYGRFLEECVQSVIRQEDVAVRVLIIDDASPDNSAEVGAELARRDNRVELLRHKSNKGHITTYNEGIDWAAADLFLLLSADDYLAPGALSRAARLMQATPSMSFSFGNAAVLYDDGLQVERRPFGERFSGETAVLSCLDFVRSMKGANIVPTPTAVVRTSAQKQVGGYCHELPHAGDMAMWLRLAAEGPVGFVGATQAVYRMHTQNMSHSYSSTRLPDVRQRHAAITHFLAHSGSKLPKATPFAEILLQDLARDSLGQAGAAYDEGEVETSRLLSEFARELSPGIHRSAPWLRLSLHRAIGRRGWRLLRSAFGSSP